MIAFAISASASGSGKTTITMGLIATLRRRGLTVQPFKTGPDYIDSAYHSKLAERPCINLDIWMTSKEFVKDTFARHTKDADVAIIEGVMGLFDGAADGTGSTASICKLLDVPVLHVIDSGKAAQSCGAILYGLENFDPEIKSTGAIFNKICGPSHWNSVTDSVAKRCISPVLGYLPKNADLALPERQLGLLSAHEHGLPENYIDLLVTTIEEHIDIHALLTQEIDSTSTKYGGASSTSTKDAVSDSTPTSARTAKPVRLGIAKDEAFCFYYEDNLDLIEQVGIELVTFSPINDSELPPDLDGLYFGGGFPEEFSSRLSDNTSMIESVKKFKGKILAECGGLIYLINHLNLIDGQIEMTGKLQACGYRIVTFNRDTILGPAGTQLKGHEFHWSKWITKPATGFGALQTDEHVWGYSNDQILASYFHIHFGSNPEALQIFKEELTT
ncbi:MAG: cobyrinate a,c-diamide synthase [Kiritimatiellaceae bacterium]|nr:cobyrinate a,c-diamide synthase [Kiritimatiellaceae bacterium]